MHIVENMKADDHDEIDEILFGADELDEIDKILLNNVLIEVIDEDDEMQCEHQNVLKHDAMQYDDNDEHDDVERVIDEHDEDDEM